MLAGLKIPGPESGVTVRFRPRAAYPQLERVFLDLPYIGATRGACVLIPFEAGC
jgi:hypothetical protein